VTTGPGDQTAPGAAAYGRFLASHTDREQVVDKLKAAFVEGRLTKDELDARAGQAFAARTYADLAALTADIPAGSAGARPRPEPAWVQGRPAVSKRAVVLRMAACAIILPIVITVVILSNNQGLAETVISPLVYVYLMALMIGVSHLVDSRLERRRSRQSGGQRPPDGRGPGGQVKGGHAAGPFMIWLRLKLGPTRPRPTCELTAHDGTGRPPPGGGSGPRGGSGRYRARYKTARR